MTGAVTNIKHRNGMRKGGEAALVSGFLSCPWSYGQQGSSDREPGWGGSISSISDSFLKVSEVLREQGSRLPTFLGH